MQKTLNKLKQLWAEYAWTLFFIPIFGFLGYFTSPLEIRETSNLFVFVIKGVVILAIVLVLGTLLIFTIMSLYTLMINIILKPIMNSIFYFKYKKKMEQIPESYFTKDLSEEEFLNRLNAFVIETTENSFFWVVTGKTYYLPKQIPQQLVSQMDDMPKFGKVEYYKMDHPVINTYFKSFLGE